MKSPSRSSVALLFAGGATLAPGGRSGSAVTKAKDMAAWKQHMGEIAILAETEGFFVTAGLAPLGIAHWQAMGRIITEQYQAFDGFVIFHQRETLPLAATALTAMLDQLGKPVVLVSSPYLSAVERTAGRRSAVIPGESEVGVRASFINAMQIALSDVGEVVVIHGSHVYRGATFTDTPHSFAVLPEAQVLGKIDFGIRLTGQQPRHQRTMKLRPKFDTRVAVIEYVPGIDQQDLRTMVEHAHGVVISSSTGMLALHEMLDSLQRTMKRQVPMVVFSAGQPPDQPLPGQVAWSPYSSRSTTLLRFMWALGQAPAGKTWKNFFLGSKVKG